jgi:hypothetical protein
MDQFVVWIKNHSGWLYRQIYENPYFFIDFWSLAHLWCGFVVFTILVGLRWRNPWFWLIFYLILYEIVEIFMLYISLHIFNPETIKDQFTDIIIGILGAYLGYLFIRQKAKQRIQFFGKLDFEALWVAETLSFLWIDRTQFFFFQPVSGDPLSVTNYLWRILPGYLLLRIYAQYKKINNNVYSCLTVFAMAYFALYILLEFISGNYTFTSVLNMTNGQMTVNFNTTYFVSQLCYPFLMILFYEFMLDIFGKASEALANRKTSAVPFRRRISDCALAPGIQE